MQLQITFKNGEAKVKAKGTKVNCNIVCENKKDAAKIAKESLAHKEYIEYLSTQSVTFASIKSMSMSNAWKFWNCGIRTIVFKANMIFGMSVDDAINLGNLIFEGKSLDYMTMDLPCGIMQDIKEVERIAIKGRVA